MGRCLATILALSSLLILPACNSRQEEEPPNPISGSPRSAAVNNNPLTQVRKGMTKGQVRNLAGTPHEVESYELSVFSLPGITRDPRLRTEWLYRGGGRVIFQDPVKQGGISAVLDVEIEKPPPGMRSAPTGQSR